MSVHVYLTASILKNCYVTQVMKLSKPAGILVSVPYWPNKNRAARETKNIVMSKNI